MIITLMIGMMHHSLLSAQDLIPYRIDSLWGYSDPKGNIQITPKYQSASFYSEGLACVQKNGKYGYIDPNGLVMINFRFDEASSFSGNRATVKQGDARSCINRRGESAGCPGAICPGAISLLSSFNFQESEGKFYIFSCREVEDRNGQKYCFKDTLLVCDRYIDTYAGRVLILSDDKWGVLGPEGRLEVPMVYDEIRYRGNIHGQYMFPYYIVKDDGKLGVIDLKGKILIPIKFEEIQFVYSNFVSALMPDGLWAYIGLDGREYYSLSSLED